MDGWIDRWVGGWMDGWKQPTEHSQILGNEGEFNVNHPVIAACGHSGRC